MSTFIKLCQVLEQIMTMKMNIYGFSVSFMNILAFIVVSSVSAAFLRFLLD